MAKVSLVIPNSLSKAYQDLSKVHAAIEMPTWAALLASALRVRGHDPVIIDFNVDGTSDELDAEVIASSKPDLVVFVLYGQNPNSGTTMMIGAETLALALRLSHPNLKVAFVGSHSSALPHEVIKFGYVDFVFINEGVLGLLDLLETDLKSDLAKVRGMWFKEDGRPRPSSSGVIIRNEDMDCSMPGYAWDLLPKKSNLLDTYRAHFWHTNFLHEDRSPFAAIYTSLGCQFACNFCMINIVNRTSHDVGTNAASSRGMRYWSADLILDQLEFLYSSGVRTLRLSDEMFFLNKKHYVPILEGIMSRGLKFNMWAYARVDSVRTDQLELFKRAGVNWLCLGIEAGNQLVRREIEKGKFADIDIRQVVQDIKSVGISILGNYMFGFPNDTYETMNETFSLATELNCEHANFYAATALPGSPLYHHAQSRGWDIPSRYEEYAFLSYDCKPLRTNSLSAAEVLRFRDEKWNEYFTNPNYLSMIEKKFGPQSRSNIEEMSKIQLRRRILGH